MIESTVLKAQHILWYCKRKSWIKHLTWTGGDLKWDQGIGDPLGSKFCFGAFCPPQKWDHCFSLQGDMLAFIEHLQINFIYFLNSFIYTETMISYLASLHHIPVSHS